mmetsp:Transcript_112323/g.204193  ORF Transcript_112323/g.204193 Transcript_112323/m.204193 type:complete len:660 (-) Transcript_112323:116-2095(-)
MLNVLRGSPDVSELQRALAEREAEVADLQAQLHAHKEADQRDFLADNSDELARVIQTKNGVIQQLQAQLQAQGKEGLAHALESAATSSAEVQRLRLELEDVRKQLRVAEEHAAKLAASSETSAGAGGELQGLQAQLKVQEQQLQLYKDENHRQAMQLAATAASHAMEVARIKASLPDRPATSDAADSGLSAAEQELSKAVEDTQVNLQKANFRIKEVEMELSSANEASEERIKGVEAELRASTSRAEKAEAWREASAARVKSLEAELAAMSKPNEQEAELQRELEHLQASLQASNVQLNSLQSELEGSEEQLRTTQASLRNSEARAQDLEAELREKDAAVAAAEGKVAQIHHGASEENLAQDASESAEVEQRIAEAVARLAEQERELVERDRKLQESEEELAKQRQRLTLREDAVASREEFVADFEQTQAERHKALTSREQAVEDMRADAEAVRKAAEDHRAEAEAASRNDANGKENTAATNGSPSAAKSRRHATGDSEVEVSKLQAELRAKSQDAEASRSETLRAQCAAEELRTKVQVLEARLHRSRGEVQEAEQRAANFSNAKGSAMAPLASLGNGTLPSLITGVLQDVELGERASVTLVDLGLQDISGLPQADRFLQLLSAVMVVRADARLVVFGLWCFCHAMYVVYLVYEHFMRR